MFKKGRAEKALCLLPILYLVFLSLSVYQNPRERLDFWRNNYDELLPKDDARAAAAHAIFECVLSVAGKRPGVVPRLFIVRNEAPNIPLAIAIPDGGIIISKKAIDICYKDPLRGEDRLAFVLAHEIAHQLKDDFWHMKFFQAVELSKEERPQNDEVLNEVLNIISLTPDKILVNELQADEYAIVFASMAGFNTNAIVTEDNTVNFFEYFSEAIDPGNVRGLNREPGHPTPQQRAESVKARLRQVLDNVDLFNLGVFFYQAGDYNKAILLFNEFLRFFPSREVYHNLASCYHQLALIYYQDWKKDEAGIPFKLSIAIDPHSLASRITLRSGLGNTEKLFQENINKAIEYYETALDLDPAYPIAYNNLGCALTLKGEVFDAVAKFKKAVDMKRDFIYALNNLGVGYFLVENKSKAKELLNQASQLDSSYDAPLFNLGKISFEGNDKEEAGRYWSAYLALDSVSVWSNLIRMTLYDEASEDVKIPPMPLEQEKENLSGLKVGDYDDESPASWGKPISIKTISLEEEPFKLFSFLNGAKIISQNSRIRFISVRDSNELKSKYGIFPGCKEREVMAKYEKPSRNMDYSLGKYLIYDYQKIAFEVRDGKVVSWLLF